MILHKGEILFRQGDSGELRADRGNPVYGGAGKQSANQHPAPAASAIKELIHSSFIAMGQPS